MVFVAKNPPAHQKISRLLTKWGYYGQTLIKKCTFLLPFSVHPKLPKIVHLQFLVTLLIKDMKQ
jgi:hypothetical protein